MKLPLRRRTVFWGFAIMVWLCINWYTLLSYRNMYSGRAEGLATFGGKMRELSIAFPSATREYEVHSSQQGKVEVCPSQEAMVSGYVNMIGNFPKDKRYLTIAMSSIFRPRKNYLTKTLMNLLHELNLEERKMVHIVVFLGDLQQSLRAQQNRTIVSELGAHLNDILHVIQAPHEFYPPMTNIKPKYGDSPSRTKWRSKQNVDFSYIMCYCSGISDYYLHLEDDVLPSPNFFPKLQDFIHSQSKPWTVLSTSLMGHIGKVLHSEDLKSLATFYFLFYDEMPCDWLLQFWENIKYPSLNRQLFSVIVTPASLFQHLGKASSLKDKTQNLSEPYFDAFSHKYNGLNPPATLTSNIVKHQGKLEDAYNKGMGYFWGKTIKKEDYIQVQFHDPLHLKRIAINSGSNLAQKDILESGVLEASYRHSTDEQHGQKAPCKGFHQLGSFRGQLDIGLTDKRHVTCLRIRITENQPAWLFIREINVWVWRLKTDT